MTYTEWRDELKNNLLSVSENERRRVLDYYAEAYADRREAGFTEREIIEEFGAPYDAAQRILCERTDYSDDFFDDRSLQEDDRRSRDKDSRKHNEARRNEDDYRYDRGDNNYPQRDEKHEKVDDNNNGWLFVLLCIIFCVPLFGLLMGMVGITIGFCVAPFAVLISGFGIIGGGIGSMVSGEFLTGLGVVGVGIIVVGVGIILMAVFTKIVKLIWKLWNNFFKWLKGLFGIKEKERIK